MKNIIIPIVIATFLIGGALLLSSKEKETNNTSVNNVKVVDGVQIVEISAWGGYKPRTSIAKAGLPTIVRFNTKGTFDCSSSVRIPSKNISKLLPQEGSTDIDIGINSVGKLKGSCSMGMYPFEIIFE